MSPSVVPLPLPECLDLSEADIIVRTSDLTSFLVHKSVLASSSWVFRDMFTLPWPPNNEMVNGLPVVDISEDSELVRSLITMLYPIPSEIPASYDRILALLAAAQKYDMGAVQSSIRAEVARGPPPALDGAQAFRAYAIANSSGLRPEMDMAASLTLDQPMTFEHLGDELRLFEGQALRELASFRKGCRDNLVSCFESFLNIDSGHSKIWVGCPKHVSYLLISAFLFVPVAQRSLTERPAQNVPTHTAHMGAQPFYPTDRRAEASIHMSTHQTLEHSREIPGSSPEACRSGSLHLLLRGACYERGVVLHAIRTSAGPGPGEGKCSACVSRVSLESDHPLRLSQDASRFCLDMATIGPGSRNYSRISIEWDSF